MTTRFDKLVLTALRLTTRGVSVWAAVESVACAHGLGQLETATLGRAVRRACGEAA